MEIVSNKYRNSLINILHQPPCGEIEALDTFHNSVFSHTESSNEAMNIANNFNLNLFDKNK